MKKLLMVFFLMAAVVTFPLTAHATPTLYLNDGSGHTATVQDGGVGDLNPVAGAVTFSGQLGDWTINVSTGLTSPAITLPELMDLNSVNVHHNAGAGALTIMFSVDGFNFSQATSATMGMGGTTAGTVEYQVYVDPDNHILPPIPASAALLGTLGPFGPVAFSGTNMFTIPADSLFSLTEVITITQTGNGASSFNASLNVPLPPTALLLGSGLLGLVGLGWRRKRS